MIKRIPSAVVVLFLLLPVWLLTACNYGARFDKSIARYYGETIEPKKVKSDYISFRSSLKTEDNRPSLSTHKLKKFLPLILYIRAYYQTSSTLNPQIALNHFTTTFASYANTKRLREKINGGKLDIEITKVPQYFTYNNDGHMVLLTVTWYKIYLKREQQQLELNYTLTAADGSTVKKGNLVLPDQGLKQGLGEFQSVRKALQQYLAEYDEGIKALARKAVEEIVAGL